MVRDRSGLGQDLVEEHLGLVLGAFLGEGDFADKDVAGLGEHALLPRRKTTLTLTTPEVTNDFGHLERVAGGELLEIGLVSPRPVGRLLGVRRTSKTLPRPSSPTTSRTPTISAFSAGTRTVRSP